MVNKRVQSAVLGCSLKNDRMISLHFQGKPFTVSIMVIQVYAPTSNAEEAEVEQFYNDLQDLLELIPKKKNLFHHRVLGCKSRKSRDTWSNRQIWPVTEWVGQKLTEFCQENALVTTNTFFQKHKRSLYTWTSPDAQYWNQIDYILSSPSWRSSIQSAKTRLEADYGSDHEFLIAKFRLKLKKKKGGKPLYHSGMT